MPIQSKPEPSRKLLRETITRETQFRVLRSDCGDTVLRQNCPDGQFWFIGCGLWRFSDGAQNQTVHTMDFAYSAPGETCQRSAEQTIVAFGVQVSGEFLGKWQETRRWLTPAFALPWDFKRSYLSLMSGFVKGASAPEELEDEFVWLLSKTGKAIEGTRPTQRLKIARDMIRSGEHSLAKLAEFIEVAPAYLASSYKRAYGLTPTVERRRSRLENTFRISNDAGKTLNEAAIEAGFYDASHFHRACRAELGMTPNEVRAIIKPGKIETLYKT